MDKNEDALKQVVKDRYDKIVKEENTNNSCCGSSTPKNKIYNIMMDDYTGTEGYMAEADLGLGCGLPTAFAKISKGDVVIDLGSGAGNDCFVARHETGAEGKVIGIDFTPSMIKQARKNVEKLGYVNVEFRQGDIDNMPVNCGTADVVVSNCVLNLVPNKSKVINEIYRVLTPGGHFSISDIVLVGELPDALRSDAEMYAGCVAGAIQMEDYLGELKQVGFNEITVQKKKPISIPEDILSKYLSPEDVKSFIEGDTGIFSITVYGEKPGQKPEKKKVTLAEIAESTKGSCC